MKQSWDWLYFHLHSEVSSPVRRHVIDDVILIQDEQKAYNTETKEFLSGHVPLKMDMNHVSWRVLTCPDVSRRQRSDKAAAEVQTCRCPSLSRLLQQRVDGSSFPSAHSWHYTADSGEQENWMVRSVLSSTEVWVQLSDMTKHNVPGGRKSNNEESF